MESPIQAVGSVEAPPTIPERLPILPLEGMVVYPHVVLPLAVTLPQYVALIDEVLQSHKLIALAALKPGREPDSGDERDPPILDTGTLAQIVRMMKLPDRSVRLLVQGRDRLRFCEIMHRDGRWFAVVEPVVESEADGPETEAFRRTVAQAFQGIVELTPGVPDEVGAIVDKIEEPGKLADFVAANANLDLKVRQELLAEPNVRARLEWLVHLLAEEQAVLETRTQIQSRVRDPIEKSQREFILREQLREIQTELGEGEEGEVAELREEIVGAELPEAARQQAEKELTRMQRMNPASAEYPIIRIYLDWLLGLPWSKRVEETVDLDRAREILDRDHYDLDRVKDRIIEYLAVRKLNPAAHRPILCFVGPPGVGKTSLGRSIAEALGRPFARISLGGVRDEAEIRGHRRTYVGALPGRFIQAMKSAGVGNPVLMLDEIDKMASDFRGDPTAAMLEVLDPAQNHNFEDHYLEVPFDLSHVTFIATANTLSTISRPLLDRMEVLELSAYALGEKLFIANRYLLPRQRKENGVTEQQVELSDEALRRLIGAYTREAGVRNLERAIAGVMRNVAERAGIRRVLLPKRNHPEIEEIPEEVRASLEIRLIEHVDEALVHAFVPASGDQPAVENDESGVDLSDARSPVEPRVTEPLAARGAP